jgi:hypothetical protein
MELTIVVVPPFYTEHDRSPIGVGLHARARRVERGRDCSDGAVIEDLTAVWREYPKLGARWGRFEVRVPDGRWLGIVMNDGRHDQPVSVLVVRTFLAAEMAS